MIQHLLLIKRRPYELKGLCIYQVDCISRNRLYGSGRLGSRPLHRSNLHISKLVNFGKILVFTWHYKFLFAIR